MPGPPSRHGGHTRWHNSPAKPLPVHVSAGTSIIRTTGDNMIHSVSPITVILPDFMLIELEYKILFSQIGEKSNCIFFQRDRKLCYHHLLRNPTCSHWVEIAQSTDLVIAMNKMRGSILWELQILKHKCWFWAVGPRAVLFTSRGPQYYLGLLRL